MKWKLVEQAKAMIWLYGDCELFLIGLSEVGILGGRDEWWNCELFQIGLKELGLA
jgi:hypothetical protein